MLIQLDADITSNPFGCSRGIAKSLSPWQLGYLGISYGHLCTMDYPSKFVASAAHLRGREMCGIHV